MPSYLDVARGRSYGNDDRLYKLGPALAVARYGLPASPVILDIAVLMEAMGIRTRPADRALSHRAADSLLIE